MAAIKELPAHITQRDLERAGAMIAEWADELYGEPSAKYEPESELAARVFELLLVAAEENKAAGL